VFAVEHTACGLWPARPGDALRHFIIGDFMTVLLAAMRLFSALFHFMAGKTAKLSKP
jgi:hypothetical protein